MRKYHIAGFAVVGASALVSAMAMAGPPQFHDQWREAGVSLRTRGCESSAGGYRCYDLEAYAYYDPDYNAPFTGWLTLWQGARDGSVESFRYIQCQIAYDDFKVLGSAQTFALDALIDTLADGCSAYGYRIDYDSGKQDPYEFPNNLSIRARLTDASLAYSGQSTSHGTTDNSRGNYSCQEDGGEIFRDVSVEIDGEALNFSDYSQASKNRCNVVNKY